MAFFRNMPVVNYNFGSNEANVLFHNLSTFVNLVEAIGDETTLYQKYTILDGDRPDVVSYKLYRDVKYYWTFFYINEHLKESGWPLTEQEIREQAKINYPYWTLTTEDHIAATKLKPGAVITGNTSATVGTIIERRLDLGQLVVEADMAFTDTETIQTGTTVEGIESAVLINQTEQYNSVHHYEDTDGNWVDIDPFNQNTSGLIPVTMTERLISRNDDLKNIRVIRPEAMQQIDTEFQKALRK